MITDVMNTGKTKKTAHLKVTQKSEPAVPHQTLSHLHAKQTYHVKHLGLSEKRMRHAWYASGHKAIYAWPAYTTC